MRFVLDKYGIEVCGKPQRAIGIRKEAVDILRYINIDTQMRLLDFQDIFFLSVSLFIDGLCGGSLSRNAFVCILQYVWSIDAVVFARIYINVYKYHNSPPLCFRLCTIIEAYYVLSANCVHLSTTEVLMLTFKRIARLEYITTHLQTPFVVDCLCL